ncbi:tyrosine-type recombinase/integrase [Pseudogulbenkiania ferrooxidans]|uniref:Integrase family protein n=1 Tax=Pseudogulbenkiania ferrooxidans 2002 TaxID=279714 RepID=B9YYR1_9NEIS|nr:site-specific integrase [Pseudogulbenkiania ferrooxidans]EEG10264.1 integrase family protein [Pseudogulbenkiania ferrooxidans 2002]
MASIIPIKGKWRATVRIKQGGKLVFHKSMTHDTKRLAEQWALDVEAKARTETGLAELLAREGSRGVLVRDLIGRYIQYVGKLKPLGATKSAVLNTLAASDLGDNPVTAVTAGVLLDYCNKRREKYGNSAATIAQYFGYLRQVFDLAKPVWGIGVSAAPFDEVRPVLLKLGLIGQGSERDRRLVGDEYARLLKWFENYDATRARELRMAPVFRYAVAMAARRGEIVGILRSDVDRQARTVVVRNRKDPRNKIGNDQVLPLLGEAWGIVEAQLASHDDLRVFPYTEISISTCFQRACEVLGIEDLHFHDLRHEGTSRLFEAGYSIEQVALVTGHKTWNMLRRYTQLRPASLHELPAAANLGGNGGGVAVPEVDAKPRVRRRRWVVKTADGFLVGMDGELGWVDDEASASACVSEAEAQVLGESSGEMFEIVRVLV